MSDLDNQGLSPTFAALEAGGALIDAINRLWPACRWLACRWAGWRARALLAVISAALGTLPPQEAVSRPGPRRCRWR
jgi:hypothetical protein